MGPILSLSHTPVRALGICQNWLASPSQFVNRMYVMYLKHMFYPRPSNFITMACTVFGVIIFQDFAAPSLQNDTFGSQTGHCDWPVLAKRKHCKTFFRVQKLDNIHTSAPHLPPPPPTTTLPILLLYLTPLPTTQQASLIQTACSYLVVLTISISYDVELIASVVHIVLHTMFSMVNRP